MIQIQYRITGTVRDKSLPYRINVRLLDFLIHRLSTRLHNTHCQELRYSALYRCAKCTPVFLCDYFGVWSPLVFELFECRYDDNTTIYCTQFMKKDRHQHLDGVVYASVIMDCIVNSAVWFNTGDKNIIEFEKKYR